jgi:hypothetical protein
MVDVPALRHDVVKRSPSCADQVGDRPNDHEGHDKGDRGEEHALVTRALEVRRVEIADRGGACGWCRTARRQDAGHRGEPGQAEQQRDEQSAPTPHAVILSWREET